MGETVARLNVVDFGARTIEQAGSGWDNTAAVERAVANLQNTGAANYKSLFFGPGTWRFAASSGVALFDGLTVEGAGDDTLLQIGDETPDGARTLFTQDGADVIYKNLRFKGPSDVNGQTINAVDADTSGSVRLCRVSKTGTCQIALESGVAFEQDRQGDRTTVAQTLDTEANYLWTVDGSPRPWTTAIGSTVVELTDDTTIDIDASLGNSFFLYCGANSSRQINNPTNLKPGFHYRWIIQQNSAGNKAVTWGANYIWRGGSTPTLTLTAYRVDIFLGYAITESLVLMRPNQNWNVGSTVLDPV